MQSISLANTSLEKLQIELFSLYRNRSNLLMQLRKVRLTTAILKPVDILLGSYAHSVRSRMQAQAIVQASLERELEESILEITSPQNAKALQWDSFIKAHAMLLTSKHIWRVLGTTHIDKAEERTPATLGRRRQEIRFEHKNILFIKSNHIPLYFTGNDAVDLYLYPDFLIRISKDMLKVYAPHEVVLTMDIIDYIEEETIASDTDSVRSTWEKANIDGTMDKRYASNAQIPIVLYGLLTILLPGERQEQFLFSNTKAAKRFMDELTAHRL